MHAGGRGFESPRLHHRKEFEASSRTSSSVTGSSSVRALSGVRAVTVRTADVAGSGVRAERAEEVPQDQSRASRVTLESALQLSQSLLHRSPWRGVLGAHRGHADSSPTSGEQRAELLRRCACEPASRLGDTPRWRNREDHVQMVGLDLHGQHTPLVHVRDVVPDLAQPRGPTFGRDPSPIFRIHTTWEAV